MNVKIDVKEGNRIHHLMILKSCILMLLLSMISSDIDAQNLPLDKPHDEIIMEYARRLFIDDLPFQKNYTPGKYTSIGIPAQGKKSTILELEGPGLITRIWTANNSKQDIMNLWIYIDDNTVPVLYGTARSIAAAAQKLSIPAVPWGGFLDIYGVSLYLPIPFKKHILIVAECLEKVDGPYWQIDYKLGIDPGNMAWKQIITPDGLHIVPEEVIDETKKKLPNCQHIKKEISVSYNIPQDILLDGPAVIRRISIKSNYLDKIQMRIIFDGDTGFVDPKYRTDHLNFQVDVPIKYLISNFNTAAIQRIGNEAIIHFPMPFKKKAMLQLIKWAEGANLFFEQYPLTINIEYEQNPVDIDLMYYFHAKAKTEITNGHRDFEVLSVRGEGHFVGVNLFNTGHDHGGGDNIFFDAGEPTSGQLHGICGEDYFHHAYMRTGINAPYIDCPSHSMRCRHHIEMPIPFYKSFNFNWGAFAGVMPTAVAMWYQKDVQIRPSHEMIFDISGPFPLNRFDELVPPFMELPAQVRVKDGKNTREFLSKTWQVQAQNGFVDLCHASRMYTQTIPPSSGSIDSESCIVAITRIWVAHDAETQFLIGCDDRVRVFIDNKLIAEKNTYNRFDPYEQFSVLAELNEGVNTIAVVVSNAAPENWYWNGFSLVLKNNLSIGQMRFIY